MTNFKALVLTCDRYHTFADHMIRSYQRHWPDHPFTFYVPFQECQKVTGGCLDVNIRFVQTPISIKQTVMTLLQEAEDDEWIYWCIDDKYLIDIDAKTATDIAGWVGRISDPNLCGVSFARSRSLTKPQYLNSRDTITDENSNQYFRRIDYSQIWLHQFLRAKVLRRLFDTFPDDPFVAKSMDAMKNKVALPQQQRLYVAQRNSVIFGESTTRGKLTANCLTSLCEYGISPPAEMKQSQKTVMIGSMKNKGIDLSQIFQKVFSKS